MSCLICYETFHSDSRKPRILPCGHSFCEDCLTKNNDNFRTCSYCRKNTNLRHFSSCPINYGIIDARPTNINLSELKDGRIEKVIQISESKINLCKEISRFKDMKIKIEDKLSHHNVCEKIDRIEIENMNEKMKKFDKFYQAIDTFEVKSNDKDESELPLADKLKEISIDLDKEKSKSEVKIFYFNYT